MRRDMDLVREILVNIQDGNPNSSIEGVDADVLKYHQALVIEAGLADGSILGSGDQVPADVYITKLTWEGHDFIEAIQDDDNWSKVKSFILDAGKQITIETIKFAVEQLFKFGVTAPT